MPAAEYFARKGINATAIVAGMKSMRNMHFILSRGSLPPTDEMVQGTAAHTALLEPDQFLREYILWEGGRRYGKEWDAFCEDHKGKKILTTSQYDYACAIRDAVFSHQTATEYVRSATAMREISVFWQSPIHIDSKARFDLIDPKKNLIIDLKTCRSADAHEFGNSSARLAYHVRLAWYRRAGIAEQIIDKNVTVAMIAVEQAPPHECCIYTVPDDVLEEGDRRIDDVLRRYGQCVVDNVWPGIPDGELDFPGWAMTGECGEAITIGGEQLDFNAGGDF